MEHYLKAWKKFAQFSGRSGKKEFWYFLIINFGISMIISIVGGALSSQIFAMIGGLFSLVFLVPFIAVTVRRMNDIGKEWWYALIPFYNLYLAVQPSEPQVNEHGPVPVE